MLKNNKKLRASITLASVMLALLVMFFAFAVIGSANDEVPNAAEKTEINVWLIGGQSNAVGYASDVTPEQAQDNRYFEGFDNVLYYGYSEKFVPEMEKVAFGQGQGLNKAGAEIGIAEALGDSGTMNIVIKYAQGATYLYPNTTSKYSVNYGTWTSPTYIKNHNIDTEGTKTGLLYTNFLDTIRTTCDMLDEMGYKPVVRGMWWMQGEAECGNATEAGAYAELLETLILDVRRDVGEIVGADLSNMLFAFGKIYRNPDPSYSQPAYLSTVTACQEQVAAKEGFNAVLVDPTDCQGLGQHDGWHFNSATQAFFGTSLVNASLESLGLSTVDVAGTNVKLSGGGFHKAGDSVTVTLTAPEGYTITNVTMSVGGAEATAINLTEGKYTFTSEGKNVVFAATTTAEDDVTPYGTIPAKYDVDNYPFAVFTDSFVGAYSYYGAAMNAAKEILYGANGEGKSATVYMRRDYSSGKKDATSEVITNVNGVLNIDLGGNTFIRTYKGYFIDTFAKITDGVLFTSTVNTKNGELVYTGSAIVGLNHSGESLLGDTLKTIALGFENVTFSIAEGSAAPVGVITACWENGANGANFDIDFVNCTFDLTNAPEGTVLLNYSGSGKTLTKVNSEISGGAIVLGNNKVTLIESDGFDSNIYTANTEGNYITLKAPTGASIKGFDDYYHNDVAGEYVNFVFTENKDGFDVYTMKVCEDTVTDETPYGSIPLNYISAEEYPFAVFKKDTKEFVGGYADFGAALNGMKANSRTADFVILMRRDAEMNTKTNVDGNLWVYTGKATIDLGGYNLSLTDSGNYLFDLSVQNNSTATLTDGYDVRATYTVMNGSITKNGGHSLICMNYGAAFVNSVKFNFHFKNVTFASTTNAKIPGVITNTWENEGRDVTSGNPSLITNMLFEDCTFDYVNSIEGVMMLPMKANKYENDRVVYNIEIKGGKLVSDKLIGVNNIYNANGNANGRADSFTFVADENGEYTTLVLPEGINAPTALFNKDTLVFEEYSNVDGIVTYKLTVNEVVLVPETTPYGEIPVEYLDKTSYPVVLFKADGTFVGAYSDFGDVTAVMISKAPGADYVVYLRADTPRNVKTSSHYKLTGNIIVDLNGFTLSNSNNGYMLDIYVGGNGTEGTDVRATYNFKNGKIVTNKVLFCVNYGTMTRDMEVYFNFDNVTFVANNTGNVMFQTWENGYAAGNVSLSAGLSQTTFAVFNDCTFDYASSNAGAIFFDATSGSGDISVVNATINGGTFIAKNASSMNSFIKFNGDANGRADSLRFGTNANGDYMKLVLPAGETAPVSEIKNLLDSSKYTLYGSDGRDLAFVIVSNGAETDEYVLAFNCIDENNDHVCDVCSLVASACVDQNKDHVCDVCNETVSECKDENNDHACDICGKISECIDENRNHLCDVCSVKMSECYDNTNDHHCDYCGNVASKCVDENNDHACDVCGAVSECYDNDDHNCDVCQKKITDCYDDTKDHKCDLCNADLGECKDENNDHKCDICTVALTTCADDDNNHKCDICGKTLSVCIDENKDHNCDVCGVALTECVDKNKDHACDICNAKLSDCVDENKDHKCDTCTKTVSECKADGKSHNCALCGATLTKCADNDKNHNCDVCDAVMTECTDRNKDHTCDICEVSLGGCVDEDCNHLCDVCGIKSLCEDNDGNKTCDICGRTLAADEPENTNIFTKIADFFKSIIDKIKEAFSSMLGKGGKEE